MSDRSCTAEPVPVLCGECRPSHCCVFFSPSSLPFCVSSETLPVEYMGGKPLCMNQYYQILSSCRIPGPKRDSIVNYAKGKKQSRHITVVHNFQVRQFLSFQGGSFRCRCPFQLAVVQRKANNREVSAHKVCLARNSFLLPLSPLALAGQQLGLPCVSNRLRGRKTLSSLFLVPAILSLKAQRSRLELEIVSGN